MFERLFNRQSLFQAELWLFTFFLISFPLSIRKIIHFYPINGEYNEYSSISLYLSDGFLIATLVLWAIDILNYNNIFLSNIILWINSLFKPSKSYPQFSHTNILALTSLFFILLCFMSFFWSESKSLSLFRSIKILEMVLLANYIAFRIIPLFILPCLKMFHPNSYVSPQKKCSTPACGDAAVLGRFVPSDVPPQRNQNCSTWNILNSRGRRETVDNQYSNKIPYLRDFLLIIIIAGIINSLISAIQFTLGHSLGLMFLKESILSGSMEGVAKISILGHKFIRGYSLFPHPNVLGGFLLFSMASTIAYFNVFRAHTYIETTDMNVPRLPRQMFHACPVECSTWNISSGVEHLTRGGTYTGKGVGASVEHKSYFWIISFITAFLLFSSFFISLYFSLFIVFLIAWWLYVSQRPSFQGKIRKIYIFIIAWLANRLSSINIIFSKNRPIRYFSPAPLSANVPRGTFADFTGWNIILPNGVFGFILAIQLIGLFLTFSKSSLFGAFLAIIYLFVSRASRNRISDNAKPSGQCSTPDQLFHKPDSNIYSQPEPKSDEYAERCSYRMEEKEMSHETFNTGICFTKHNRFWHRLFRISLFIFTAYFIILGFFPELSHFTNQSLEDRNIYINVSRGTISDNFFLGTGMGNYVWSIRNMKLNDWQYQPVHNIFMLIWSELGLIGLALLSLILIGAFFERLNSSKFIRKPLMFHVEQFNAWWGKMILGKKMVADEKENKQEPETRTDVPRETFELRKTASREEMAYPIAIQKMSILWKGLFIAFIPAMLFDHYFWDIQQGEIMFWMVIGIIYGLNRISYSDTISL